MSLPPIIATSGAPMPSGALGQLTQAVLAVGVVGATVALYAMGRPVPPELLVLASAIVATYFAGYANRQVNGTKVEALTAAVQQYHAAIIAQGASSAPAPAPAIAAPPIGVDPLAAAP